jgi:mannose-1-phosphate guanylyltransferase/mannose-6-phosphate isomerase
MLHPVLLSGGAGTRLWPLSRRGLPKQLLSLVDSRSLLQETAARVADAQRFQPPLVVTGEAHRFLIAEQLRQSGIEPAAIVLEPCARNTAPAAALAALWLLQRDPDAVMALMPTDHMVRDRAAWLEALDLAEAAAQKGFLVIFGVQPAGPETGYGYIEHGEALEVVPGVYRVEAFTEKPDAQTAQAYLDGGRHLWNSGMAVMRAQDCLSELEQLEPKVVAACRESLAKARVDLDFLRVEEAAFAAGPSISLDHAVMERTAKAAVVPADFGWSDVGAWDALWQLAPQDSAHNAIVGAEACLRDTRGCYIRDELGRLVTVIGVEDMVIVSTRDALLVSPRSRAQEVGAMVKEREAKGRSEVLDPPIVHRPWGTYEDLDAGPRFRVKRIVVKPGGQLSLQRHKHRSEHWVVVSGWASIVCGERVVERGPNESVFVPVGMVHRIENKRDEPLALIEVQCGDYLGEDDIERLEDVYQRA